ncbi:MAG: hypothetical protein ACR2GR_07510 [Rhodothermales bacterium]
MLFVAGCTGSRPSPYQTGEDLVTRGRYAEAVQYYVLVMEQEPTGAVRKRLLEAGTLAADAVLAQARTAERQGRYDDALQTLEPLEALFIEIRRVGVPPPALEAYEAYRASLQETAVAAQLRKAEQAERTGNWAEALQTYEALPQTYALGDEQRAELDQARARALLRWSQQTLDQRRYRDAYQLAQEAINAAGGQTAEAVAASRVQEEALAEGTRRVAFLPMWVPPEVEHDASPGQMQATEWALRKQHWDRPPLFLASTDAVQLRRELGRLSRAPYVTPQQSAEIGRVLDADYVVMLAATRFEQQDSTEIYRLDATYAIIDPYRYRAVDEGTLHAEVAAREGLPLADALASRLADALYRRLLRLVE